MKSFWPVFSMQCLGLVGIQTKRAAGQKYDSCLYPFCLLYNNNLSLEQLFFSYPVLYICCGLEEKKNSLDELLSKNDTSCEITKFWQNLSDHFHPLITKKSLKIYLGWRWLLANHIPRSPGIISVWSRHLGGVVPWNNYIIIIR